jgi:uncharacterized protein involved in exopolysaccharide biosynthesis
VINEEQHGGYSLRDVFHVLFKRKWLIISFAMITSMVGGVITLAMHQTSYEATSQILLSPGREHIATLSMSSSGNVPPRVIFDLDEQSARTIEMLTGRYLADQVVQALGARTVCHETMRWSIPGVTKQYCDPSLDADSFNDRAALQVMENVRAERVGTAALVNLSFRHPDPAIAARVVNTLGNLYLDRHLGVLKNPRTEQFVQEQATLLKGRMAAAESEFEEYKVRHGISSSIKEEREIIARQMIVLETQQNDLMSQQAGVSTRVNRHRAGAEYGGEVSMATRERLRDLETKERELAVRLGDRNPELIGLREQLRIVREEAAQEESQHFQAELNALRARSSAQTPKMIQLKQRLLTLDRLEPDFDRLAQRVQSEQQSYRAYMAKAEEARVSNAMDEQKIASVRVIEPARAPTRPTPSKLSMRLAICLAIGMLGALIIAFALELFSDRLETAERVESVLNLPLLASIPVLPRH